MRFHLPDGGGPEQEDAEDVPAGALERGSGAPAGHAVGFHRAGGDHSNGRRFRESLWRCGGSKEARVCRRERETDETSHFLPMGAHPQLQGAKDASLLADPGDPPSVVSSERTWAGGKRGDTIKQIVYVFEAKVYILNI